MLACGLGCWVLACVDFHFSHWWWARGIRAGCSRFPDLASSCVERWNWGWNYLVFVFNLPVTLAHLQLNLGSNFFLSPLSFPLLLLVPRHLNLPPFRPLIYYISSYKCGGLWRGSPLLKKLMARTLCVQVSHPSVSVTAVSKHTGNSAFILKMYRHLPMSQFFNRAGRSLCITAYLWYILSCILYNLKII